MSPFVRRTILTVFAISTISSGFASTAVAQSAAEALLADPGALAVDRNPSRDGVYQLSWAAAGPVVLEASEDRAFTRREVVYRGPDSATTVSGQPDGGTYYRLIDAETRRVLGHPVLVEVHHHSLARALTFFFVGLFVFTATIALIVRGARETRPVGAGAPDPAEAEHG